MGEFWFDFRRFAFASTGKWFGSVEGLSGVEVGEDLGSFGGVGVEIMQKPKKVEFCVAFRRFGFVSLGEPSGDVGGCSGGDGVVDLAAG